MKNAPFDRDHPYADLLDRDRPRVDLLELFCPFLSHLWSLAKSFTVLYYPLNVENTSDRRNLLSMCAGSL